ncbi:phenylalanyl-tRNA synthetase beta subunit [Mariniphaga anaerophila]|uniref:Phenylalanine--tRNA ligase beta subunit n=1 Tax=Mariniphaga anaerophila TaxID=1484053 RepID=A0A1M4T8D1_9BACT|nr:phenylalanine--tRNA ligase subunit beta [Mariniphaga anaerophila]SHE40670.1 phenylalanyl-tRNA synthetase beta subunit [Mariniphaga anaerophila]
MKISYNWLKDYINTNESPEEVAKILTQTGLEVAGLEEVETVKGGMQGLVLGKVVTCEKHPNSDHLSKTTVDVGTGELLNIVCGAPNVAAGQKVVVAPVGTTLYMGDEKLTLKKMKIRGEASEGMICAEDEIGLGTSHDGIMVLPDSVKIGTPAKEYFNVKSDQVIEVDLTPNRIDGGSHIGVARDLAAFLNKTKPTTYNRIPVDQFKVDNHKLEIPVEIKRPEACPRYAGVTISDVEVKESPDWLKNRLKAIGQAPINNVVDITNYVLFETGQPLHAFDADKIEGGKVIVQTLPAGTKFTTLDEVERELHEDDLMICNTKEAMCIGGVFGGTKSGVKEGTKNIFLESAWFDPVFIRKTARRHGLNTDASFRFERGTDPNGVIYALKRAALLIKELAGGTISSEIVDVYPKPAEYFSVQISYNNVTRLVGKEIGKETIKKILTSLEIEIENETETGLSLLVPPYRVDVKREADVIEEILRIYGYNNIEIPSLVKSSLQYAPHPNPDHLRNLVAEMLTAQGFNEIWSNSLTKAGYYEGLEQFKSEQTVNLLNPLSADLNGMRQTLLFGGLECVAYNANRQNKDLMLYEFGNCYFYKKEEQNENPVQNYHEEEHLGLFITGEKSAETWTNSQQHTSFFQTKSVAENILKRMGFNLSELQISESQSELFSEGLTYQLNNKTVLELGIVAKKMLKRFDVEQPVYYADFNWKAILTKQTKHNVSFEELPKFPAVRRDLALLVDKQVKFQQIEELAVKTERKILRQVGLFDVYEGNGVPEGKKSYAVSFILRDDSRTLNDKQIDKTMKKLVAAFERELGAELRK